MHLSVKHAVSLITVFLLVCATFVLVQHYSVDLIRLSYDACHFLYGLVFPMVFGFIYFRIPPKTEQVPFRIFIAQVRAVAFRDWPQVIVRGVRSDLQRGIPWSPWAGALWIAIFSIANEVFIDPMENGIPFTSAYSNLVADLFGIAAFLVITHLIMRGHPAVGSTASTM